MMNVEKYTVRPMDASWDGFLEGFDIDIRNPLSLGNKLIPPLITGILIMGPYKPLRTWVDDHPLLYVNNGSLDPGTHEA